MTKKEVKEMSNEMLIFLLVTRSTMETKKAAREEEMAMKELEARGVIDYEALADIYRQFYHW